MQTGALDYLLFQILFLKALFFEPLDNIYITLQISKFVCKL